MKMSVLVLSVGLLFAVLASGQKAKSQKELDILLEIQHATDPDLLVAAVHNLLFTFKNTEFKEWANQKAMTAYSQLNDFENMLIYGEETLAINPNNVDVLVKLAYAIPTRTKEFDFDKEEKLSKAEDFARKALRIIPIVEKPRPDLLDEEWLNVKSDLLAEAHNALALVAFHRKDFEAAEQALKRSIEIASSQNPTTFYHYARTLQKLDQNERALEMADKSIELGGVNAGGKDLAKNVKAQIIKLKAREMFNFKSKPATKQPPAARPVPKDNEDLEDAGAEENNC